MSDVPIFVFTIGPCSCFLFPSGVAIATPASTCSGSAKPLGSFTPETWNEFSVRLNPDERVSIAKPGIESVVAFLVLFVHRPSGRRRFHCFAEVRIVNHRFKIGDRVRVIGILADFYPGKIGTRRGKTA